MALTSQIRVALDKVPSATAWGTAISVNKTNAEVLPSEYPEIFQIPEAVQDPILSRPQIETVIAGNRNVNPSLEGAFRFNDQMFKILACLMGADEVTDLTPPAGVRRRHYFRPLARQPDYSWLTVGMFDGIINREVPSYKPTSFTLSGAAGGFLTNAYEGIGDTVRLEGINTPFVNPDLGSITPRTTGLIAPFGCLEVLVNDYEDPALSLVTDQVLPTSIELSFVRPLGDGFAARGGICNGEQEWTTSEPSQTAFPDIAISMEFAEYISPTRFFSRMQAGTYVKMSWKIVGPQYDAVNNLRYQWTFLFPKVLITSAPQAGEAGGKISETVEMQPLYSTTPPTGFTEPEAVQPFLETDVIPSFFTPEP